MDSLSIKIATSQSLWHPSYSAEECGEASTSYKLRVFRPPQ